MRESWKMFWGYWKVLEKSWKFFWTKEWEPCQQNAVRCVNILDTIQRKTVHSRRFNRQTDWRSGGATVLKVGGGQILRAKLAERFFHPHFLASGWDKIRHWHQCKGVIRAIPKLCLPVSFASKSGGHVPPAPMGAPPKDWRSIETLCVCVLHAPLTGVRGLK